MREIDAARFFWLLVPPVGVSSAGAWVELQHARERGLQVIASGDTRQSVFTALVPEYDDDAAAFEAILSLCGVTP